ncbi:MAG: Ig-like domain-containing protein [Gemmatimonadaceae bacterium]|nr:Ig-like domain-containing protein [Gemmatimonadaceae bacterium]
MHRAFSWIAATSVALLLTACGESTAPERIARVEVRGAPGPMASASTQVLTVAVIGSRGGTLSASSVSWQSSDPSVATVSTAGVVTASRVLGGTAGAVTITATVEGIAGTLPITVLPVPIAILTVTPSTLSIRQGQTATLRAATTDSFGLALTGRRINWATSAPAIAAISPEGVLTTVSPGRATITATAEGREAATLVSVSPPNGLVISDVRPAQVAPGTIVELTGEGLGFTPAEHRVLIGGVVAPVQSVTGTTLTARVPCTRSGNATVQVIRDTDTATAPRVTVSVPRRTLAVGQAVVLTSAGEVACNELAPVSGPSRYVVAVYSGATSANTLIDVELSGNPGVAPLAASSAVTAVPSPMSFAAPDDAFERAHLAHRAREERLYQSLRAQGAFVRRTERPSATLRDAMSFTLGDMRTLYYNFGGCRDSTQLMRVRLVYAGTRGLVWEDSANALQSAAVPAMATAYERLGRMFDRDQYETVRATFGDPLIRDADTDADGRIHMVFTQRLNGSGAAAYVTGCDQVRRGPTTGGSNFGEYFYGFVPTNPAPNLASSASPDGWVAFMSRTVVHEVKHIASTAQRVAVNAQFGEVSWLEEGTARHAEEVWARDSLHRLPWKGNIGWGSASASGVFCDFNLADATCTTSDPLRRPAWGMRRHFNELRPKLLEPWNWSPYGDGTGQSGSVFYQTTWSLVRYAIDRYGASDAAFLGALNRSTTNGITNLTAVAGVPMDRLLGEWGLALYTDDWPGLASNAAAFAFATWNLRGIYGGLSNDPVWRTQYPVGMPLRGVPLPLGAFTAVQRGVRGGAHAFFELSGTLDGPQLLSVTSLGGVDASPFTRLAVMRLP